MWTWIWAVLAILALNAAGYWRRRARELEAERDYWRLHAAGIISTLGREEGIKG